MGNTETSNAPDVPKKTLPKVEGGAIKPSEKTKTLENAPKPGEKLEKVNQELQKKYTKYREKKSLLEKANKEDVNAPGRQDAADKSNAENTLKNMEDAYRKDEKTYQETQAKDISEEKKVTPSEQHKALETKGLEKGVTELHYDAETLDPGRVKYLATTFPSAWKETLFNPESPKNPALKQVSNIIIADCMKCPRAPGSTEEQFQKVLLEHIKKTIGIDSLTLDDAKLFLEKRKKSYDETEKNMGQKQPNESASEYTSRTVDSAANNGTGEATLGEAVTSGDTAGYSGEVGKPLSENAAETAKKIKEVFKDKPELHKFIDRHAGNNSNFSAQKPFLMQNLSAQRAYIYYPGQEKPVECSATHGVKGISNTNNSHGTSLGSKELVPDTNDDRGNKIKIRTAIKGLESCNSNDFSRDIRVHEQHGSKTWGCTGLPMEAMVKFDAAIDAAGGGAMEVFTA